MPLAEPEQGLRAPPFREEVGRGSISVGFSRQRQDIEAALRLRYSVFVEEMGANLPEAHDGIEEDAFDPYCLHLVARDKRRDLVVGTYRLLTDEGAKKAGGYYSETEFDISALKRLDGKILELGRACVHPEYRSGATIALLWAGLARFLVKNGFSYLIGCASVPLSAGPQGIANVAAWLKKHHGAPDAWRVTPKRPYTPLPESKEEDVALSPLFKGYLRVGAVAASEPALDPAFGVADFFLILPVASTNLRYVRHFIDRC